MNGPAVATAHSPQASARFGSVAVTAASAAHTTNQPALHWSAASAAPMGTRVPATSSHEGMAGHRTQARTNASATRVSGIPASRAPVRVSSAAAMPNTAMAPRTSTSSESHDRMGATVRRPGAGVVRPGGRVGLLPGEEVGPGRRWGVVVAEGAGFEPAGPGGPTVFKTVPFVRSGTPPRPASVPPDAAPPGTQAGR